MTMSESSPSDLLSLSSAQLNPAMSTKGALGVTETTLLTWKVTLLHGLNPNKPINPSNVTTSRQLCANVETKMLMPPPQTVVAAYTIVTWDTRC